jgi:tetratricopeptide (TPR) repeat protein
MAAWCYVQRKNWGKMSDPPEEIAEAAWLSQRAVELGQDNAVALCSGGFALAQMVGSLETGAALIDRALVLDPNLAAAWFVSGWVRVYLGQPEAAIESFARAMRLNPLDPLLFVMQTGTAAAHFLAGRYHDASSWAEQSVRQNPNYLPALRMTAASHALAGRLAQARKAMTRVREIDPAVRITNLTHLVPFRRPEDFARYAEGLRIAGLPG